MDIRRDSSFIEGQMLQAAFFGLYNVNLAFSNTDTIPIETKLFIEVNAILEYHKDDGNIYKWDGKDSRSSNLCISRLMEIPILRAFVDDKSTLHLNFESGGSLKIIPHKEYTESYNVSYKGDFEVIGADSIEQERRI